jgi:hypothetical protein
MNKYTGKYCHTNAYTDKNAYTDTNVASNRKQKVLAASLWDALHVAPTNITKSIAQKCI